MTMAPGGLSRQEQPVCFLLANGNIVKVCSIDYFANCVLMELLSSHHSLPEAQMPGPEWKIFSILMPWRTQYGQRINNRKRRSKLHLLTSFITWRLWLQAQLSTGTTVMPHRMEIKQKAHTGAKKAHTGVISTITALAFPEGVLNDIKVHQHSSCPAPWPLKPLKDYVVRLGYF